MGKIAAPVPGPAGVAARVADRRWLVGVHGQIAARAERLGVEPQALAYDMLLENGGRTLMYRPITNYVDGNLDACAAMMKHPNTVLGLGDGVAHIRIICDSATVTHTVVHWTRDRTRGPRMELPWIIQRLPRDPAWAIGLGHRPARPRRDRAGLRGGPERDRL